MISEYNNTLLMKAQCGEKDAQDKFLYENKGLVHLVVKKYMGRGADNDDLIQLGMIGLYKAMMNFNKTYNVSFSTYAVPMICGEIKRYLRDDGLIKISRSVKELYVKIKYAYSNLEAKLLRTPKISEIAKEVGVNSEEVIYALNALEDVRSLEETIYTDEKKLELKDKLEDKSIENEDSIVDKIALNEMISKLKPRERQIIILRFFKEMTQKQVADILGVSQVQVCRIEKNVLKELKKMYM